MKNLLQASIYIAVLTMLMASSVFAQGSDAITLEAELSRSRAFIGDQITYQVLVRGSNNGNQPNVSFPDNVRAEYRGASSQQFTTMRTINGRQRAQTDAYFKHQYLLTVVNEGTINIPAATLEQDGVVYQSQPVTMTALLPQQATEDVLLVELPDRPIYTGESVRTNVTWWVGNQTQALGFESSAFPDTLRVRPTNPLGPASQEIQLEINGQQFIAHVDQQGVYKGQPMTSLRFDLILTPTQAGIFDLGPLRVVFTRPDEFSRAARMYAQSAVESLRVIDVPRSNQPSGYNGLIGNYEAIADASNTKVNVGDPIEFRVLVNGPEPMIGLERTLRDQPLEELGFRISPDGWKEVEYGRDGQRLYTITIRATNDDIDEIPAIKLPAFNPDAGEFEIFASRPIPLDVRPVRSVTLSDAITSGPVSTNDTANTRSELVRNPSLLWAHPDAASIQNSSSRFTLAETAKNPVWIGIFAAIIGLPIISYIFMRVYRSRDPKEAELRAAWKLASKLHKMGQHAEALRVYAGAIAGIDPDSLTDADLKRLNASDEIIKRSSALLGESESASYGKLSPTTQDRTLLMELRKDTKSHIHASAARRSRS